MFKENLMSALKKAVDYHNGGMGDNASVVKSAAEYNFNPDQAQRLVETYNTAKTICFYKTAEDRSQQFQLADAGAVLKELFKSGAPVKAAADPVLMDYSCYDAPIRIDSVEIGETQLASDFLKAAAAEPEKLLDEHNIRAIYRQIDDYRKLASDAELAASSAEDEYRLAVHTLATNIVRTDSPVEGLACIKAASVPAMAKQVAEDVAAYFGGDEKKAAEKVEFTAFDVRHSDIMELHGAVCAAYVKQAECASVAKTFSKMADDMETVIKKAVLGEARDDFFSDKVNSMVLYGGRVKLAQQGGGGRGRTPGIFDPVGLVTQSAGRGAGSAIQDVAGKAMTDAMSGDAESRTLTDRAKKLHRKFILEKLITLDPILKGLPEEDVIGAYQTLVQLAPEVSLNEDVSRSILRAATASAGSSVAPYDAKTFVDLDAAIRAQLEQPGGKKKPEMVTA